MTSGTPVRRAVRGLPGLLLERAGATPTAHALTDEHASPPVRLDWAGYAERCARVGLALLRVGVLPGERVAIAAHDGAPWLFTDLGAQGIGATTVGLPAELRPDELAAALRRTEAVAVIVDVGPQLSSLLALRQRIPALRLVIVVGGSSKLSGDGVLSFDSLQSFGGSAPIAAFGDEVELLRPAGMAIISHAGRSLDSAELMFTHGNVVAAGVTASEVLGAQPGQPIRPLRPLSVLTQRITATAVALHSASPVVLSPEGGSLPPVAVDVSRGWSRRRSEEHAYAVRHRVARVLSRQLVAIAHRVRTGEPAKFDTTVGAIARLFYARRARRRMGLAAVTTAVTTDPLPREVLEHLGALGVVVNELWGPDEVLGLATVGPPFVDRPDTVGRPVPGTELRISQQGEVLIRGPHVLAGYVGDEFASRQAVDPDGWLHSGYLGRLDSGGLLTVSGRMSTTLTTSEGHRFAPEHLESRLRASPYVRNALVVQDAQGDTVGMVELDVVAVDAWAARERLGLVADYERLAADERVVALIEREAATSLANSSPGLHRVVVLKTPLDAAAGELSPSLEPNRELLTRRLA